MPIQSSATIPEGSGFGNMIKNFWSKYIYSGINSIYKAKEANKNEMSQDNMSQKIFDDYPDFSSEVNLIKDMNQCNKELSSEFNLSMEIDGLEKL